MKVFSQLEKAQLENTTSDTASLPKGMATYRTDLNVAKISDGATMKEIVDTSTSQILSLKEIVTPIIPEVATPANPAAGKRKVYFKSDGVLYQLNSAGLERPIGSGGGGGSLEWLEDANAPVAAVENFMRIFKFEATLDQALYALVKVPKSYIAGSPIKLYSEFVSSDTSGDALIRTVTTLVRQGIDVISSTTNQHTSPNSAVTLSGATQDIPQGLELDLCSSVGQVNGVNVSAGDLLLVRLERTTDTATGEVKVPVYAAELTFTA